MKVILHCGKCKGTSFSQKREVWIQPNGSVAWPEEKKKIVELECINCKTKITLDDLIREKQPGRLFLISPQPKEEPTSTRNLPDGVFRVT